MSETRNHRFEIIRDGRFSYNVDHVFETRHYGEWRERRVRNLWSYTFQWSARRYVKRRVQRIRNSENPNVVETVVP